MAWSTSNSNRSGQWQDLLNMLLAIWLFFSPWVIRFGEHAAAALEPTAHTAAAQAATMNAWWLGVITFLVSASSLIRRQLWQEWLSLILGAWIFIAPWVLGFHGLHEASFVHWIVGALIFAISASSLSQLSPTQRENVPSLNERGGFGAR